VPERFGIWGLGFGVWGVGCGVWGFGFRVWGSWCRVQGLGCLGSFRALSGRLKFTVRRHTFNKDSLSLGFGEPGHFRVECGRGPRSSGKQSPG